MSKFDLGDYCYEIQFDGDKEILVKWRIESVHINGDRRFFMLKETEGNGIDVVETDRVELSYFSEESIVKAVNWFHEKDMYENIA